MKRRLLLLTNSVVIKTVFSLLSVFGILIAEVVCAASAPSLSSASRNSDRAKADFLDDRVRDLLSADKRPSVSPTFYYEQNFAPGYDSNPKLNDPAEYSSKFDFQSIFGVKGQLGALPIKYDIFGNWESLRFSRLSYWDQDNFRLKGKIAYTGFQKLYGITTYASVQSKNFYERWFSPWFMRRDEIKVGIEKNWEFYSNDAASHRDAKKRKMLDIEFGLAATPRFERKKDGSSGLVDTNNSINYEASLDFVYVHSPEVRFILANELGYRVFQTKLDDNGMIYTKRSLKFDSELLIAWDFLASVSPKALRPVLKAGVKYERAVDNTNDGYYRWTVGPIMSISGRF